MPALRKQGFSSAAHAINLLVEQPHALMLNADFADFL
jgi:hypothetical protein